MTLARMVLAWSMSQKVWLIPAAIVVVALVFFFNTKLECRPTWPVFHSVPTQTCGFVFTLFR
jgi:hypothetical protein